MLGVSLACRIRSYGRLLVVTLIVKSRHRSASTVSHGEKIGFHNHY